MRESSTRTIRESERDKLQEVRMQLLEQQKLIQEKLEKVNKNLLTNRMRRSNLHNDQNSPTTLQIGQAVQLAIPGGGNDTSYRDNSGLPSISGRSRP